MNGVAAIRRCGWVLVERAGFEPTKRVARQIYSLLPLTTRPSLQAVRLADRLCIAGAREGTRTPNLPITNRLRCQLRHPGSGLSLPTGEYPTQKRSAAADQDLSMRALPLYGKAIQACTPMHCRRVPEVTGATASLPQSGVLAVIAPPTPPNYSTPARTAPSRSEPERRAATTTGGDPSLTTQTTISSA